MSTLHDDLDALTADQPQQPGDRLIGVTGKARRIRRTRAAVSVAAVVALAAPLGAVLVQRHEQAQHFATTPISQWPDRSYVKNRGVADGAVTAYRTFGLNAQENVGSSVRWLFRGTVALPDHDDLYVAVFVTTHNGQQVVVTAQTRRSQVDSQGKNLEHPDDPSSSPWVTHEEPSRKGLDHIGVYVEYQGPDSVTDPVTHVMSTDQRNELFVLADPASRDLRWTQQPVPFAAQGTDWPFHPSGTLHAGNGLFLGDAGPLVGPVTVDLVDRHGNVRRAGALSPTSSPDLARATPPTVPASWTQHFGAAGSTERQSDGSWSGPASFGESSDYAGRTAAVEARCYGGGSVVFTMADGDKVLARRRVACDGRSHEALRHLAPPHGFQLDVGGADRLISLQYVGGTVS